MIPSGESKRNQKKEREHRKRHGIFYTPEPVARFMVCSMLKTLAEEGPALETLTILDPACGDGAFLFLAYRFLCNQLGATSLDQKLEIIRKQIFGVDLDPVAVDQLRSRLLADLGDDLAACQTEPASLNAVGGSVRQILQSNFQVGDSVSGLGWDVPSKPVDHPDLQASDTGRTIDWSTAFPQVKQAGGFDVVFANPPYRRERGAKRDAVDMAATPLGKARHHARMDLWHYFFHRSLDLLRPGGSLGLIVNSAWATAQAGRPLVARLESETTPQEFVLLNRAPVFENVDGRHLILRLRKAVTQRDCRVWHLNEQFFAKVCDFAPWDELLDQVLVSPSVEIQSPRDSAFTGFSLARHELFQTGGLWLHPPRPKLKSSLDSICLLDQFEVRQGIAENPPRITRKHRELNPGWKVGQGVFLLSDDELGALDLSEAERRTLRPYWEAAVIDRYWLPPKPTHWLLYLTRDTAPKLEELPRIEQHLQAFRPLLEQRRETRLGKLAWWHLHWPRESRLFDNPKILAVQMGRYPRFVCVRQPAYVGFSVNLIVTRVVEQSTLSLEGLAAVLNSTFAADWFDHHAKRRGVHLDITGGTLKQFPLASVDSELLSAINELAKSRALLEFQHRESPGNQTVLEIRNADQRLDELIERWFLSGEK